MPRVELHGIQLYYQTRGSGDPLVLLHGLGSCGDDWEHQIPVFAEHFTVIAPDLRGFGRSDKPVGPYSVRQYARDVLALMDHLGVDRCHLLGFSMGGAIAFQIAVDAQERLKSMVVVNSLPSYEVDHWRKHLFVIFRVGMAHLAGMRRMTRFVAKRLFPKPHQRHLRRKMRERHGGNDRRSYLAALNALKGWSVMEWIAGIHVPTLVVAADEDYSSIEEKEAYVARLPDARLKVIRDSRHASHFDQPEQFNKVVIEFLLEMEAKSKEPSRYRRILDWLKPRARQRDGADAPNEEEPVSESRGREISS